MLLNKTMLELSDDLKWQKKCHEAVNKVTIRDDKMTLLILKYCTAVQQLISGMTANLFQLPLQFICESNGV